MTPEQEIKSAINQGQFDKAISLALTALGEEQDKANKVSLMYTLAVAYRLAGDANKALETNAKIIAQAPKHARAYQEMAYINKAKANALEAAKHFYQATQINPALLSSWQALLAFYQSEHNDEAATLAQAQIDYLQGLPKQVMHARDLMYEGQLHQADQLCRRFLQTQKHQVDALLLLAEIGIALKVYAEAEFLLESCLELHPGHKAAGIEYLKLLSKMGRYQAAKDMADKLLAETQDHPPLLSAKASALVGLGELDEATELYQKTLSLVSQKSPIYLLLGHAYKAKGQLKEAISAYRSAYQAREDFGDAYWSLANTKTYQFDADELKSMQALAAKEIDTEDKIHIEFALGKAFEDSKDYDKAFAHYAKGNKLKAQQSSYSSELISHQVANQKRVFTKAFFESFEGAGCPDPAPIFIVGLPRAGSTLLEQILASHSKVDGTMELHNILSLAARLHGQSKQYPDMLSDMDSDYFRRFGEQFIQDTQVYRQGAVHFIDKMPNNFMHIGLIKLILPNAKIIDARREPMACCFSGFKQLFGEGQEFTYGLENIGQYYVDYVDMMAHWDEVLPGFVLRVQHEDVLDNLEEQVKRMLDFCNLEFEQACVDFHQTKRVIKTPSSEQVRQPIFKSSVEQWKHFEQHLKPLLNKFS